MARLSLLRTKNRRTAIFASSIIVGMLGLTAASVPLYDLFCRVTGYGGTPQRASSVPGAAADGRTIQVSFNADHDPGLPWRFQPLQRRMEVVPGESYLAFFAAENRASVPIVGRAVYNVTPFKVGGYFAKVQCFCFDEQLLQPGERVEMPVSFFVDPAIFEDADTKDVVEITLSYTFYEDPEASAAAAADETASLVGTDEQS